MKVGGNGAATEFFTKHGGSNLLSNSDARARYTSRTAGLYKEEIERKKREDASKYPDGIHIDGLDLSGAPATGTSTPDAGADDFFSSWDKEAPKAAAAKPAASGAPPSIGAARTTSQPRTVTSSSLRSTPAARPAAASRLSSSSTSTASKPMTLGAPKASKLGAKKANTTINFEEAQKRAQEEEERVKRLGYDRKREEEERAVREAEQKRMRELTASAASSRSATPVTRTREVEKPAPVKMGFGQITGQASVPQPKAA